MGREYFLEELQDGLWHVTDGDDSIEGNYVECISWIAKRIIGRHVLENPSFPSGTYSYQSPGKTEPQPTCRGRYGMPADAKPETVSLLKGIESRLRNIEIRIGPAAKPEWVRSQIAELANLLRTWQG